MTNPRISFIVLNWNNSPDTLVCLESLMSLSYANFDVILVDNGSTDDSVSQICGAFPNVILLETGENLGYAGGNNVGIRYALERGAEFICILNNDIVVESGFLEPLLAVLQSDSSVGVATPLIADMVDPNHVWTLGAALNDQTATVLRLFTGESVEGISTRAPFEVDIAPGSAMLVRRAVFERVGLLNEDFFLYYEEADWSLLVRKAGCVIMAVPQSLVRHKISAALGTTSPVIDYYMQRNQFLFISRHWAGTKKSILLSRAVLRTVLSIIAFTLKSHHGQRLRSRNARVQALRDALLGRWGKWELNTTLSVAQSEAKR